jgi:GntR family transcriptional regulator/MocR family aminotransferase
VAVEDPGYEPVFTSFHDHNFALTRVPVEPDGIRIEKLPTNIRTAAYVNPSNQFPTGAVMPIARRHMLLNWAEENDSFIIEDDYDSELRYTGRPIPAMQGLDSNGRVIYLGSFSSTLFAAVKISYMVLPAEVLRAFGEIRGAYAQTCSKTEQLTLALFMEKGHYQTGIKKLRRLYAQKLRSVLEAFEGHSEVRAVNTSSGINVILELTDDEDQSAAAVKLIDKAGDLGIKMLSIAPGRLMMNYNQIPLEKIPQLISSLLSDMHDQKHSEIS